MKDKLKFILNNEIENKKILSYYSMKLLLKNNDKNKEKIIKKKIKKTQNQYLNLNSFKKFFTIYNEYDVFDNYKFNENHLNLKNDDDVESNIDDINYGINKSYSQLMIGFSENKNYLKFIKEDIISKKKLLIEKTKDLQIKNFFTFK